jgi:hypothetical protein
MEHDECSPTPHMPDLWMDSPYVVAARKLWTWAREANDAGEVFPIHGTCLGFQLLHILEANVSFTKVEGGVRGWVGAGYTGHSSPCACLSAIVYVCTWRTWMC